MGACSLSQILMHTGPDGSLMSKGRAIAAAMAGAMDGESTKLTDDAVVLLEQQYGPLDRNLPTGGSFGELSLADAKLARRNATIIAAEPASLIRIDKQLYRKTLYEMQVRIGLHCVFAGCVEWHITQQPELAGPETQIKFAVSCLCNW